MRVAVEWPAITKAGVDLLTDLLADYEPTATVEAGVPRNWTPADPPHFQVRWDGTPDAIPSVVMYPVFTVIARANGATETERLALLAYGLVDGPLPDSDIRCAVTLTGPLLAEDDTSELASFTFRATIRSELLTGS